MRDAASVPYVPMPEPVRVVETVAEAAAPEPVVQAPVVPAAVAAPQPVAAPAPVPVSAPAQALKLDWSSGLQQVETSRERQAAAQTSADDGAPKRIKRVRPPVESIASEPLQQVETRS
jgi:hypothetical protein